MNTVNIVVSRYNKNVDFVYKINNNNNINVMIYDKENLNNPLNIPVNKGNEASVYLKYIIDYYDELTDFTFFIHDEEYSWHHSGSIIDKFNEALMSNKMYYNINDKCHWNKKNSLDNNTYNKLLKWYNKYIEDYIPISKVPNNSDFIYNYLGSAQFLVHKDLIKNLPKEFYIKIYEWIITTDLPNSLSGRFLEWTWHIFWYIYPNYINNKSVSYDFCSNNNLGNDKYLNDTSFNYKCDWDGTNNCQKLDFKTVAYKTPSPSPTPSPPAKKQKFVNLLAIITIILSSITLIILLLKYLKLL